MRHPAHITLNGTPLCERMGTIAFDVMEEKAGRNITCDYLSTRQAQVAAKILRPFFGVPVRVVPGPCPKAGQSKEAS